MQHLLRLILVCRNGPEARWQTTRTTTTVTVVGVFFPPRIQTSNKIIPWWISHTKATCTLYARQKSHLNIGSKTLHVHQSTQTDTKPTYIHTWCTLRVRYLSPTRLEELGIEPVTLQLLDNTLYRSHPGERSPRHPKETCGHKTIQTNDQQAPNRVHTRHCLGMYLVNVHKKRFQPPDIYTTTCNSLCVIMWNMVIQKLCSGPSPWRSLSFKRPLGSFTQR